MAKVNNSVGILDTNFGSISLLNQLIKDYPCEHFYYLNDFNRANFDEWSPKAILEKVKEDIEILKQYNPKLIIVLGNEYIQFASDYLYNIDVRVLDIASIIIKYINENFAKDNIAIVAKENVIKANIYQKNISCLHLYSLESIDLERIVLNDKVKTGIAFETTKKAVDTLNRKSVDEVVPLVTNLCLLNTEFKEYLPKASLLNIGNVISAEVGNCLMAIEALAYKGKGRVNIIIDQEEDKKVINYLLRCKYYIKLKKNKEKKARSLK